MSSVLENNIEVLQKSIPNLKTLNLNRIPDVLWQWDDVAIDIATANFDTNQQKRICMLFSDAAAAITNLLQTNPKGWSDDNRKKIESYRNGFQRREASIAKTAIINPVLELR